MSTTGQISDSAQTDRQTGGI